MREKSSSKIVCTPKNLWMKFAKLGIKSTSKWVEERRGLHPCDAHCIHTKSDAWFWVLKRLATIVRLIYNFWGHDSCKSIHLKKWCLIWKNKNNKWVPSCAIYNVLKERVETFRNERSELMKGVPTSFRWWAYTVSQSEFWHILSMNYIRQIEGASAICTA